MHCPQISRDEALVFWLKYFNVYNVNILFKRSTLEYFLCRSRVTSNTWQILLIALRQLETNIGDWHPWAVPPTIQITDIWWIYWSRMDVDGQVSQTLLETVHQNLTWDTSLYSPCVQQSTWLCTFWLLCKDNSGTFENSASTLYLRHSIEYVLSVVKSHCAGKLSIIT